MAYTLELAALLTVFGFKPLIGDWMIVVDALIIACGWAEILIASLASGRFAFRTAVLRALRLVRIFRLMRLLTLGVHFPI